MESWNLSRLSGGSSVNLTIWDFNIAPQLQKNPKSRPTSLSELALNPQELSELHQATFQIYHLRRLCVYQQALTMAPKQTSISRLFFMIGLFILFAMSIPAVDALGQSLCSTQNTGADGQLCEY